MWLVLTVIAAKVIVLAIGYRALTVALDAHAPTPPTTAYLDARRGNERTTEDA